MAPLVSEDPCRADPDLNTGSRQKGPGWFGMVWDVVLLCIIAIPTVPKKFREDDPHTPVEQSWFVRCPSCPKYALTMDTARTIVELAYQLNTNSFRDDVVVGVGC